MLIKNANKIVLKLGSTTVIDSKGVFKKKWVTSLIKDIKKYGKGKNFVIVSSGAIALGQKYLKIKKGTKYGGIEQKCTGCPLLSQDRKSVV